jgi:mannose-6-phosphate isomerase
MYGHNETLRPIKLQSSLHETIWGGDHLAAVAGKDLAPGSRVGESWETEVGNVAVNPPYAGRTLASLAESMGDDLLGTQAIAVFGRRFPLLAKFIDASDRLSVQVHPDDVYAREHADGSLGKTEAWYILRADPGARLVLGLDHQSSADEVRRAIDDSRLEALLHEFPVRVGDVVFVPAGMVHGIGAGIVLYELQEYSDITYRLYDYGRVQANGRPRDLHVDRGLAVMRYGAADRDTVRPVDVATGAEPARRRVLVACRYFVLEEIALTGTTVSATTATSCSIVTTLAGHAEIAQPDGQDPVRLALGQTAVLPALMGPYTLTGYNLRLLHSYVPTDDDALARRWSAAQGA